MGMGGGASRGASRPHQQPALLSRFRPPGKARERGPESAGAQAGSADCGLRLAPPPGVRASGRCAPRVPATPFGRTARQADPSCPGWDPGRFPSRPRLSSRGPGVGGRSIWKRGASGSGREGGGFVRSRSPGGDPRRRTGPCGQTHFFSAWVCPSAAQPWAAEEATAAPRGAARRKSSGPAGGFRAPLQVLLGGRPEGRWRAAPGGAP